MTEIYSAVGLSRNAKKAFRGDAPACIAAPCVDKAALPSPRLGAVKRNARRQEFSLSTKRRCAGPSPVKLGNQLAVWVAAFMTQALHLGIVFWVENPWLSFMWDLHEFQQLACSASVGWFTVDQQDLLLPTDLLSFDKPILFFRIEKAGYVVVELCMPTTRACLSLTCCGRKRATFPSCCGFRRAKEKVKEGPTYQCGGSLAGSPKSRFAGLRMLPFACLDPADADEGVVLDGQLASCAADDAWLGVRGRPGVLKGKYQFEVELQNPCLLRVGWAALNGRRALGTDERSFGYGGTGMKSNAGRFEKYGEIFEAQTGAVVTCLLDRQEPRRHSISYCLNGRALGVAFRLPPWLAEVPLYPALCGREDWQALCRFRDLRFPHGGFRDLDEACASHVVGEKDAENEAAKAVFAAAPFVEERELKQLDVPDENLVELEGEDGSIDEKELKSWLIQEYGISSADFHAEFAPARGRAVLAFTSHRVARSMQNAPPPRCQVSLRPSFSAAALDLIRAKRPTKGATTDAVARRLIAGALDGDTVITKDQLRAIRAKASAAPAEEETAAARARNPRCPPAPAMPTLDTDTESESSSFAAGATKPKRFESGRGGGPKTQGRRSARGAHRRLGGCWLGRCAASGPSGRGERAGLGPRNALAKSRVTGEVSG
ncbi:unnamed protein product [Effrenium voratum]|uniref:SPRY domain-containing protein n=1 Tax=Effrenium voratum TaxID=2562239 RepID=A0AA36NGP7_9DINO|nr:unnamed protein product [Effrenium voratum]